MKAITINVYRKGKTDSTNGGISSRYDNLLLICEDGYITVDENNVPENAVRIVERQLWEKNFYHIEPITGKKEDCVGWMPGGNIAFSWDSRYKFEYPLLIWDRQDTQAVYDRLTR